MADVISKQGVVAVSALWRRALLAVCAVCVLAGVAVSAQAQTTMTVEIGKSTVLPLKVPIDAVFIADDTVADISVSPGDTVFLYGKSVGETNVIVSSMDGRTLNFNVVVTHNLSELRRSLAQRFPGEGVRLESARGTLSAAGVISSEAVRGAILQTLRGGLIAGEVVDRMVVSENNLIRLQVRVLEVNRNRAQSFGIDWDLAIAGNGFFLSSFDQGVFQFGFDEDIVDTATFSATINLLVDNNIATIIQDTTLTAVNGEQAGFRVGTEFPIPKFSAGSDTFEDANFSVEYQFVGTDLQFTPTFGSGNRLRLEIDSTLSELLPTITRINGNDFPNTTSRSFATTVELEDGQPFAIAGLTRDVAISELRDSTGTVLSDAVNTVFGADRTTGTQQDLVVIVTPILSSPAADTSKEHLLRPQGNLHFILASRKSRSRSAAADIAAASSLAGFQY